MKRKPLPRRCSSVADTLAGVTSRAALSRKKTVSSTPSASRSRNSWAISSRPVASGTRAHPAAAGDADRVAGGRVGRGRLHDLLGAAAAVARAPVHVGMVLDLFAQLEDAVHQRLGAGRAARD